MKAHRTLRVVGAALLATLFVSGCASVDDAASSAALTQELACVPSRPRPCPCLPMGTGTQTCLVSGDGYGPCMGCPPLPPPPDPRPALVTSEPAEVELVVDASMLDEGTLDAGMLLDAVADGGEGLGDAALEALPVEIGTSCGVGLPAVCELGAEKCCVRSLATDTCIAATDSCDCDVRGCSILEAHCDGPEDCDDGQVCCGTLQGSTYSEFSCVSNCDYRGSQRIGCHQSEAACPDGTVCSNSQLLTNLQVCIDPATIEQ